MIFANGANRAHGANGVHIVRAGFRFVAAHQQGRLRPNGVESHVTQDDLNGNLDPKPGPAPKK